MNTFGKICFLLRSPGERGFQDLAGLLFHRPSVYGSTDFQLALGGLFQISNGDVRHAINASTAIIDCTPKMFRASRGSQCTFIGTASESLDLAYLIDSKQAIAIVTQITPCGENYHCLIPEQSENRQRHNAFTLYLRR